MAALEDQRQALKGLNWLAGCAGVEGGTHSQVHDYVARLVKERGAPDFFQSEEEAARTLLRDRVSYDAGCSNVAAFEQGCVSLPDDISGAPMLDEALPHAARRYLKDEFAPMLRSEAEILELADHARTLLEELR